MRVFQWRTALCFLMLGGVLLSSGCGYMKNVRDDWMDVGTAAVGVAPPTVSGEESPQAIGILPPTAGVYLQATDFLHLGLIGKGTGDLCWDRRGAGVIVDKRIKSGFGPWHKMRRDEEVLVGNEYKITGNRMDPWRQEMLEMKDPIFEEPAKRMIFHWEDGWYVNEMSNGWQDWEMLSVEIAIPEPFITHSGFYVRAGIDPSQFADAILALFAVDLYNDRAYERDGSMRFTNSEQ